jgi:D-amino-acid oxidase
MPVYMRYLEQRFTAGGGRIETGTITDLEAATRETALVVHCTGLGARELAHDRDVFPIRGQVVRVRAPWVQRCLVHDATPADLAYMVPRSTELVLGGTAGDHDWNPQPDAETERRILARCARLAPGIERAEVVGRAVGLRPGRPTVRLEVERLGARRSIVHNYGHGGSGVTLSWGCAEEVVELVRKEVQRLEARGSS